MDPRELVGSKLDELMKITFDATNSKVGGSSLSLRRMFAKPTLRFSRLRRLVTMPSEPSPSFGQSS